MALVGCSAAESSPAGPPGTPAPIGVVASTGIYGDIAETIGGDAVEVTVLIDDPEIDPHEFQGTARDVLALSRADVVIINGGGYDGFTAQLLDAADNPDAHLIDLARLAGVPEGGNEHVFYDPRVILSLTDRLTELFTAARPDHADRFADAARSLRHALEHLDEGFADLRERFGGTPVAVTDPAAEAFAAVADLTNRTPDAFLVAVEDGTGVAPRLAHQVRSFITNRTVAALVTEAGAVDPQVAELSDLARHAEVPVVTITEMLPAHLDYVDWMDHNREQLAEALEAGR